jgi:hypothetical protein
MSSSRRRPRTAGPAARPGTRESHDEQKDPFILWWMPVVALVAPLAFAAWTLVSNDSDPLAKAAFALLWPGVPLYLGAIAVLWGGWKIELE